MSSSSGANNNMAKVAAVLAAAMLGIAVLMFANGQIALGRPKKLDDDDDEPRQRGTRAAPKAASAPAAPPGPPAPPTEQELIQMEYERLSAEGVAAFKAGDYDEAVARFTDALVLGSTHDFLSAKQRFVYQNRSASFDKMGRIKEALDDCAKILLADGSNSKAKARREKLYKVLIEKEDFEEALVEQMVTYTLMIDNFKLQRLLGQNPELPQAPEQLEPLTIKLGTKTLEEMEAAGELHLSKSLPGSHTLKQILRMLPSYTGLLARAGELRPLESITADIDALPAEAEAERTPLYFERALVCVADGRLKRAEEDLDRACNAVMEGAYDGPQSADILSWAGLFIHLRNESERALTILKKARELNLADSEICVKLSAVYLDREEVEDGKKMLAIAEQLAPTDPYVQCWIAQSHMYGATDPQQAIEATINSFQKALAADENFVPALYRLGQAQIQLGHLDQAEELITKARKLAPRDSDVAMVYAALLGTRNDVDGAVKQLDKAVRLEPNNAQPYYQKAVMAAEAGHMSEALDQLRQLLDVEPTFIPAHMLLIQLNLQTDSPIEDAQRVFQLIKTALATCRTKEDVKQLLYFKVTLNCRVRALQRLGRSCSNASA